VHLIERCLDANPLNRSKAKEILRKWRYNGSELIQKKFTYLSTSNIPSSNLALLYKTYSEASILLDFETKKF
jgi:hypothetical protein